MERGRTVLACSECEDRESRTSVSVAPKLAPERAAHSSVERLMAECLKGNETAWAELIDSHKNLIYSIPIKLGMYDDAPDIFQAVCVDLLSDLEKLREPKALPKWLMQVCYHKCLEYRTRAGRQVPLPEDHAEAATDPAAPLPDGLLAQVEREQMVRDVVGALPPRCARMIRMLFYETPPLPYQQVARELGIATGSIGFIRGRCLQRLKKHLE